MLFRINSWSLLSTHQSLRITVRGTGIAEGALDFWKFRGPWPVRVLTCRKNNLCLVCHNNSQQILSCQRCDMDILPWPTYVVHPSGWPIRFHQASSFQRRLAMAFSELWTQLALGGGHWADGQLGRRCGKGVCLNSISQWYVHNFTYIYKYIYIYTV
jgi:hypothetical protein